MRVRLRCAGNSLIFNFSNRAYNDTNLCISIFKIYKRLHTLLVVYFQRNEMVLLSKKIQKKKVLVVKADCIKEGAQTYQSYREAYTKWAPSKIHQQRWNVDQVRSRCLLPKFKIRSWNAFAKKSMFKDCWLHQNQSNTYGESRRKAQRGRSKAATLVVIAKLSRVRLMCEMDYNCRI